jgi:hypothetical protein
VFVFVNLVDWLLLMRGKNIAFIDCHMGIFFSNDNEGGFLR